MLRQQTEIHLKRLLQKHLKRVQYLVYLPNNVLIGRFNGQILDNENLSLEVSYRIAKILQIKA